LGLWVLPQGLQNSQSIQLRQANVQKDNVWGLGACHLDGGLSVVGDIDAIPVELELQLVHLGNRPVVFDEQHPHGWSLALRAVSHLQTPKNGAYDNFVRAAAPRPEGHRRNRATRDNWSR
ncbi:MAG: hypothetical protein QOI23_1767, partial [Chloroflexota bacterium]|nr:hypothetical protein [Chloroflexota bacterium]